ncbi:MAG: type II toxin-antitoxin system VapC family toxin [Promethearchaeota archaeon]
MIFVDANIWIYLFDKTVLEHNGAVGFFDKYYDSVVFAVNAPVLVEVMHYLVKRLGVPIAREKWKFFRSLKFVAGDLLIDDLDAIFNIFCEVMHTGIGGRDATILGFMRARNITRICTHDKSFKGIPNIEVLDPIEDS